MTEFKNTKFISIVVCTYNGESRIKKCVTSLLNQNYPKSQYEVIVVVDGSKDKTISILKDMPVVIVNHEKNMGIAASRNSGLKRAKGDIYVCFDDDCYAEVDWLSEIIKSFDTNIAGVCGVTKNSTQGTVDLFLDSMGHGNPSPIKKLNPSVIGRFFEYFIDMYKRANRKHNVKASYEVAEIWGENCSFITGLLSKVGGWDTELSGVEDTDLCYRIKKITNNKFVCNPNAVIYHDGKTSFYALLVKPYVRGLSNLRYYLKINKIPPIFPFPIIIILISGFSIFYLGWSGIFISFLIIYLLYSWWTVKYLKTLNYSYLFFPFIQFSLELSTLVGMFRGAIIMLREYLI